MVLEGVAALPALAKVGSGSVLSTVEIQKVVGRSYAAHLLHRKSRPPQRSPKADGHIEHAIGTRRYEFR